MSDDDHPAENSPELTAEVERLKTDNADLQRTFDVQWEADQRAIKRWQQAHPGNDHVWPDRADMVVWLMEQLAALEKEAIPAERVRLMGLEDGAQAFDAENKRLMAALRACEAALAIADSHQPCPLYRDALEMARASIKETP